MSIFARGKGESKKHKIATQRNYLKGNLMGLKGVIRGVHTKDIAITKKEDELLTELDVRLEILIEEWDMNTPKILSEYYSKYDC